MYYVSLEKYFIMRFVTFSQTFLYRIFVEYCIFKYGNDNKKILIVTENRKEITFFTIQLVFISIYSVLFFLKLYQTKTTCIMKIIHKNKLIFKTLLTSSFIICRKFTKNHNSRRTSHYRTTCWQNENYKNKIEENDQPVAINTTSTI